MGSMRYSSSVVATLHDEQSFCQNASIATHANPFDGIIFPSPLLRLIGFKIVDGSITEYMNLALEGNGKDIAEYYFGEMNDAEIEALDEVIINIAVPCQLSRLTRKISERHLWKAKEWENSIFYYSIPIFSQVLEEHEFEVWLLYCESMYIVLQDVILDHELARAEVMLNAFVEGTEDLHGLVAAKYNLHLSLHVCRNVRNWGPVWAISAFGPETCNRYIELYPKMHFIHRVMDETLVVDANEIERVYVHMEAYSRKYICPVPNLLHY
ncbi:hypothetical protein QAD02_007722 [Eretmocerus hayati]|uniref:Uncharacterized protein n=1 Tax=Eretmocerus hayati TaxID=131215 RepID=A0ACC2N8T1_9HYME|nr:hypothetical protein QAD02_007722 [Eretmocerus hayati]